MQDLLSRLNPQQRVAVTTIDGAVLIIAGAGSGKTGVITARIARMLEIGIAPESILALTFTNKAAGEMVERVRELLAADGPARRGTPKLAKELTIGTFHAFGLGVLRRYGRLLGYRPNFSVYDTGDQISLLKEAAREVSVEPEDIELMNVLALFSATKTERIGWGHERWQEVLAPSGAGATVPFYRRLYDSYQAHLLAYNAVDFDDLIVRPLELMRTHDSVRQHYVERFRYIMVDEFQDTSAIQYQLLAELARTHRNVCVVGDDDQSIYSWRGADYANIESFERDFPERVEITLDRNYRSTGPILDAANAVIANNTNRKLKALWTGIDGGRPVELSYPDSDEQEAAFIAEKIKLLSFELSRGLDAFGILVRTNSQTRIIEEALLEADIPYSVSGGQSFFQRKEIKDVAAYMRVVLNPDDNVSVLRTINVPRRGIGRRSIEALHAFADERHISLYSAASLVVHGEADIELTRGARSGLQEYRELIETFSERFADSRHLAATTERLVDEIGYWPYLVQEFQRNERAARAKWKNIGYFIRSIDRYETNPDVLEPSLAGFLNRISLQTRDELSAAEADGTVALMTIHAAKGLEFDIVFLAGVEQDLLPHRRSVEEAGGLVDEERRLFYVAITRARERLYVTSCRRRQIQNEVVEMAPSPFLAEIPDHLIVQRGRDATEGVTLPDDPFAALRARLGE